MTSTQNVGNGYQSFLGSQQKLVRMLQAARASIGPLSINGWSDTLQKLHDRVTNDRFRVMILGEFKRGKSTFINALLGQEVLPAFATPCTAVINEVKWGEEKRAVLHFRNPVPNELPSLLPERATAHLRSANGSPIPPLEIPVSELEDYVVIPDPSRDHAASVAESPYSKVELLWPLKLCSNGVEIIDSPGLNEHTTRTKVTSDYLAAVDAVVFVMSCHALGSQSEVDVIDNTLIACGHEDLLFVCNRFDEIRSAERDRLVKFARAKLSGKTSFGEQGVFFLSALDALEGRTEGDAVRIDRSGITSLEAKLERFLVEDRGRVKLFQPARELSRMINDALNREIPQQRAMLEQSLTEVQRQYAEAKPQFEDAQRKSEQILRQVENSRAALRDEARLAARAHMREVASCIEGWCKDYQPKNTITIFSGQGFKAQGEALLKEVAEWLTSKIEVAQQKWRKEELEPLVKRHVESMTSGVAGSMQEFLSMVDKIKTDISGLKPSESSDVKDPAPWERILAAAGGFFIGGVGSAMVGGTLGFKEMLISLIPNITISFLTALLVGLNPWILIPVLLATGSIQGLFRSGAMADKVKMSVAQEMTNQMRDRIGELSDEVGKACYEFTDLIQQRVRDGMLKEIQAVHDQVQAVLTQLRSGEAAVAQRRKVLEEVAQKLGAVDSELNDYVLSLTASLLERRPISAIGGAGRN